jgi:hypothetical protein
VTALPFALELGEVLDPEPRAVFDEGAVYGSSEAPAVLAVAWLDEPPGVTLDDVLREDLPRMLSEPGSVLLDRQDVRIGDVDAVRTFVLRQTADGMPAASEQWRMVAAGRRWTVSAMTPLADQPEWGPRLAAVAATFRVA